MINTAPASERAEYREFYQLCSPSASFLADNFEESTLKGFLKVECSYGRTEFQEMRIEGESYAEEVAKILAQ